MSAIRFDKLVVDNTTSDAFLVRKDLGGSTVFSIDTSGNIVDIVGNITVSGTVDGIDIATQDAKLVSLHDTIGLSGLTSDEVDQLENIGTTTISATQWGYLGLLDQSLATTDDVVFNKTTIDGTSTETFLVRKDSDGGDMFTIDTSGEISTFQTRLIVNDNSSKAFLVEDDSAANVFYVDTNSPLIFNAARTVIDVSSSEALNIRKLSDGGDVFVVDTLNNHVTVNSSYFDVSGPISGTPSSTGAYIQISTSTFTDNVTAGSGTATSMVFNSIAAPTLAATNSSVTTTDASTLYIEGPPSASTNQTITNPYSLLINEGVARINEEVSLNNETSLKPNELNINGDDPFVETFSLTTKFPSNVISYHDFAYQTNLGRDVSGNTLHGESYSIAYVSSEASRDNVAQFDQTAPASGFTTQRLDLSEHIYKYQSLDNCSISMWFKSSYASAGEVALISFSSDQHASTDFTIYLSSTKLFAQHRVSGTVNFQAESTSAVNDDAWHNVIIRLGSSTVSFYIDNVEQTTYNTGTTGSTDSLDDFTISHITVGANYNSSGYRYGYNGFIADLIIFNEQISATIMTNLNNDDYGYDTYALMGQSNMVGRADIEAGIDDDYTIVSGKVFQFPYDVNDSGTAGAPNVNGTTISAATNPLDHISDPTGGSSGELAGDTGMWKTFSETIINTISARRKILLIPVAKGSTSLASDWSPGDVIYDAATQTVNQAMSLNPMNKLRAILWIQGESDSGSSSRKLYGGRFKNMYDDLVTTLNDFDTSVPFILGGIKNVNADEFNPYLENLADPDTNKYFVNTDGLTTSDGTHYDATSIRTFGTRFGNAFLRTLYTSYQSDSQKILDSSMQIKSSTESALVVSNTSSDIFKVDTHNSKVYVNSAELVAVAGDLSLTTFSGNNNQAVAANVTNFIFPEATVQSFFALVTVVIDATADLYEQFQLRGLQKATGTWVLTSNGIGDSSNVAFTITSSSGNGQIQYTSDNYTGFSSLTIKFRSWVN